MQKRLFRLLIIIVPTCLALVPFAIAGAPSIPVWFTEVASTGVSPEVTEIEAALLSRINSADTSIEVAIYDFNRDHIRDALISAHQRGVQVRVVTDDEARFHINSYVPYYQALESAGISIVDDNREADIMHNKFAVFDSEVLWTGSMNWSDNGVSKNTNNALVITDTTIAQTYLAEFNQMYLDGKFSIHKTEIPTNTFEYNGIDLEVHFSPEGNALDEIVQEVISATESIYFAVFFFTSDELRDALIDAHNRGVTVVGIWDKLGASNAFSDDEFLCEAGIQIKIENWKGKNHHKYLVIDATGANPRTVTGSMNLSNAGDRDNDENTIIIWDASVTTQFKNNWDEMYDSLPEDTACLEEAQPNSTAIYLPVITNPIDPNAEPTPTPTPSPTPTQTPTPEPSANVEIVRIVYDPDGSDVDGELIEITNSGNVSADMTNWIIEDEAGIQFTFPSFTLNPSSSVSVWVKSGSNDAQNLYWGRGSSVWNNNGDSAFLLDEIDGNIIDSCSYEGGQSQANCQ